MIVVFRETLNSEWGGELCKTVGSRKAPTTVMSENKASFTGLGNRGE